MLTNRQAGQRGLPSAAAGNPYGLSGNPVVENLYLQPSLCSAIQRPPPEIGTTTITDGRAIAVDDPGNNRCHPLAHFEGTWQGLLVTAIKGNRLDAVGPDR
ncbi:hypothetical protein D3C80_267910 [compost metagenome]